MPECNGLMLRLMMLIVFTVSCDAWCSSFSGTSLSPQSALVPSGLLWKMGMQVKIRIVGRKNGLERWLEEAYSMYETRLRPSSVEVETVWYKSDQALVTAVEGDASKGHSIVMLDPAGKMKTSEKFSVDFYDWLDRGGSRLVFVVGGANGLPSQLKHQPGRLLISLSQLTFTHQFARVILMEQIYRASEIRKGSGYHK